MLSAEAAATQLDRDPDAARAQLERLRELAGEALEELRSLILGLRPPSLEVDGLEQTLRKEVAMLGRIHGDGHRAALRRAARRERRSDRELAILRISHEALHNALRHAGAERIAVRVSAGGDGAPLTVEVSDDGAGFDPARAELRSATWGSPRWRSARGSSAAAWRSARHPARERRSASRCFHVGDQIRVLIVDDHAVVREGLRAFLGLQDGIEIVGEAADGIGAVEEALRARPDVVLMDLVMPRLDGVAAMRELRHQVPEARVIVLTSFLDDERVLPAIQAGAAGYLLKNAEPVELARAVREAYEGSAIIDPTVAARLVGALSDGAPAPAQGEDLTQRERQVLELIAGGRSNKRIAFELGISEKTVKTHVGHLLGKLGVDDRTQAAMLAVRRGLVRPKS